MILTFDSYISSSGQHPKFVDEFKALSNYEELTENANILLCKVSELAAHASFEIRVISSGWRPAWFNKQIGGSVNSKHIFAQAIDIWDPDKKFGEWCMTNQSMLQEIGLYMEDLSTTHASPLPSRRWVHLQIVPPKSGKIIFLAA